jgi:hypothetical protein
MRIKLTAIIKLPKTTTSGQDASASRLYSPTFPLQWSQSRSSHHRSKCALTLNVSRSPMPDELGLTCLEPGATDGPFLLFSTTRSSVSNPKDSIGHRIDYPSDHGEEGEADTYTLSRSARYLTGVYMDSPESAHVANSASEPEVIAAYSCKTAKQQLAKKEILTASLTFNAISLTSCSPSAVCAASGLSNPAICSF